MTKKSLSTAAQKRKPRLLWANPYCLLDTSSGASMAVRQMLHQLVQHGYEVQVLGCTIFDNPKGMGRLKEQYPDLQPHFHQLIEAEDGVLSHHLVVTARTARNHLTAHEEGLWYSQYLYLLDSFKPDIVWFYGGQTLDLLIPDEARARGIPSAFYLANGNYKAVRWCRDIDLILTDSQATAEMYKKEIGYTVKPIGSFLDPSLFVAENHKRERLLFVNPSWQKGASIVVQLALALEKKRPNIQLEVVEARADWSAVLRETTKKLGEERSTLSNVIVTPNTNDMRPPYSRARLLLAPSLWWESSGRVLAEAMLNGIPALITNRGGMPEMIGDAGLAFDFPEECYEDPYQHLLNEKQLQPLINAVLDFYDDTKLYEKYVQRAWEVGKQRHHIDKSTERLVNALTPLIKLKAGNKDFTLSQQKRHRQGLASIASKPKFKVDASLLAQIKGPNRSEKSTPLPAGDFDWQLSGKLIVLDSRAKLLKMGAAKSLTDTGAFGIIAFDPASEVSDFGQYEGNEAIQVFQHALLGNGSPATLYACLDSAMSSTLEPLPQEALPEHHRQGTQVLTKLPIKTIALDNIEGLPSIDWLILDELSDTPTILEYGQHALKNTLIIQASVAFQPTHKHQPSLAELQHWASRNDFRFYRFNNIKHYSHLPDDFRKHRDCATEQESAEVLFLPSHKRMSSLDSRHRMKLAFILSSSFGAHDIAYELLYSIDQEMASSFLKATGFVPSLSQINGKEKPFPIPNKPSNLKVKCTKEVVYTRDFLHEKARKGLTEFLNEYHGLNKSERFWDICLHYFLGQSFISSYLARWNNGLLNSQPGNDITSHFPCSELMELDHKAYARLDKKSPFFSYYLNKLEDSPQRKLTYPEKLSDRKIITVRKVLKNETLGVKKYAFDLGSHHHEYWKGEFSKESIKLVRLPTFWVEDTKYVDFEARSSIAYLDISSPLENFTGFWSSLALCLPAELLEFFPELLRKCNSIARKYSPKFILSTQLADASNRVLAAVYAEKGVPLHLQQHGGAYGEYSSHVGEYEIRISDIFYTWGWGEDRGKLHPAPPHRLEILEYSYKKHMESIKVKNEILIIGPHRPLVPSIYRGTDNDPYNNKVLFDFLKNLKPSSDNQVVFRFRRQHGYDEEFEKSVVDALPKGSLIDTQKRPIAEAYAKSKEVIIVDPFTTSALECEHLGIPYKILAHPSKEFTKIPSFIAEDYS